MKNKLLFCALLAMGLSEIIADDVVKGKVGFSLYPTIEDIADAYEKSETDDLRCVAADLVSSRNVERKKYSLANAAEVELQALPGFKVLRKVKVNDKGEYITKIKDDDPDCRVFCRYEIGKRMLTGATYIEWDKFENCYCQHMQLRNDYVSVTGHCIDTNGMPVVNARIYVRLVRTPVEQEESRLNKSYYGRTDEKGVWRVDGIESPSFDRMLLRICNTNVINRYDSTTPPYGVHVGAHVESEKGVESAGSVEVPNVTARDRAAAERIFAAYKRKTGKDWPRPAPMTDFPVSTNNVIYVPDIVLKK